MLASLFLGAAPLSPSKDLKSILLSTSERVSILPRELQKLL